MNSNSFKFIFVIYFYPRIKKNNYEKKSYDSSKLADAFSNN